MKQDQNNIRFAFFGTPDIARDTLEILHTEGFTPVVIICAPDRPIGRKQVITPPPTKVWAEKHNIPTLQPEKLDESFQKELAGYDLDLSITAAFGMIMPREVISLPKLGTLNIHYSLLPKHRGAIPTQAAILHGDTVTGVTIQQMQFKLDSGPIIAQEEVTLDGTEIGPDLQKTLTKMGAELMVKIFPDYLAGNITPIEQNHEEATHEGKLKKSDGEITPDDSDIEKWRKYRAFYGWPGIFYFDEDGKRIKVTQADFIDGRFVIQRIIPEGGTEQAVSL